MLDAIIMVAFSTILCLIITTASILPLLKEALMVLFPLPSCCFFMLIGSPGSGFQIKSGSYNVNVTNNVCNRTFPFSRYCIDTVFRGARSMCVVV